MISMNPDVPRIIHLMFFPWGKDQQLLADSNDFDHGPYERMIRYAPDFEVKLWDYPATEALCLEHYPDIWRVANEQPRPMMLVNTLRWLMVYHFGGISWQYDMNPLVPMERILPSPGKECRVFTEFELTPAQCRIQAPEPIRKGEPEETVRIPSQAFAAVPRHRYMKAVVDFIHGRCQTYTFKRDYDCQFMSGNAAASTAYDRFGKNDPTVERIGLAETRRMMKFIYQGTWRTEESDEGENLKPDARGSGVRDAGCGMRERCATKLWRYAKRMPGVQSFVYRRIKPHAYEAAFEAMRLGHTEVMSVSSDLLTRVATCIREVGVQQVLNYPCAHFPDLDQALAQGGIQCVNADMVRGHGLHLNLLYDPVPRVDLVVMRNFLDHINTQDALLILERLRNGGVRYLLSTDYPCLNCNWNNVAGEWRPLSLTLPPYNLSHPERGERPETNVFISDADEQRRPDRSFALFRLRP